MASQRETISAELDHRDASWWIDWVARMLVFAGGVSAIIFIVGIFVFITAQGLEFTFQRLDWVEFFTSIAWRPTGHPPTYGALALIVGTLSITALAMAIAVPFSFGAAIYIGEFARGRQREWLKILIELLAAVPSVVWGVIGLHLLSPMIQHYLHPASGVGTNLLNASIILGLMAAPIMTTIAEDALKAVPEAYREAAEALGATRWQVVRRVVLPHARPGLSAAVLLGVGRAVGETMAVLMASGHAIKLPTSLCDPVRALTATIAAELGETSAGSDHYQVLFTLGMLLFLITFAINLLADRIVRGSRRTA
ncbi:MAG TPA: phosphate ABC transporter permease subunit PstC [Planctomycetota bacterium]|nr:phosphate ABC transporter permease subunit PstC [Planctomycetota bacterium]